MTTPSIDQLAKVIRDHVFRNAGPMQLFEWSVPDIKEPHAGWRLAAQVAQALATTIHKAFAGIIAQETEPTASKVALTKALRSIRWIRGENPLRQIADGRYKIDSNVCVAIAVDVHDALVTDGHASPVQSEPTAPPAVSFATIPPDIRLAIRIAVTSGIMTNGARDFLRAVQDQLDHPLHIQPSPDREANGRAARAIKAQDPRKPTIGHAQVRCQRVTCVALTRGCDCPIDDAPEPPRGPEVLSGLDQRARAPTFAFAPFASQAQEPKEEGINLDPNLTAEITRITQEWLTRSTADRIKAIAGLYTVFASRHQDPTQ